jgi:hypothetical protein
LWNYHEIHRRTRSWVLTTFTFSLFGSFS